MELDEAELPDDDGISAPFTELGAGFSDGSSIDEQTETTVPPIEKPAERAKRERARSTSSDTKGARDAKSGPPSLDEWTGFFSRVVLRVVTEYYINYAFRGVDEDMLTERELDRLAMTDEERQMIAVPFAELSNKSKFMRKHGRMIVASGDAFNAVVVFGMWTSRVQRIANKYKPRQPRTQVRVNGSSGSGSETATPTPNGATGGRFPEWFSGPIIPGSG